MNSHAGDIAARPIEARDKAGLDRIATDRKDDRDRVVAAFAAKRRPRRPLRRRKCTATCRSTSSAASAGSRSSWPSAQRNSIATFWPSTKPASLKPWRNACYQIGVGPGDRPLRNPITGIAGCCARAASGQRRRTAEQRDELAPLHSITSSARASRRRRISRPSALAVLRLITNSNLVDCSTGRSAGLAP